MAHPTFGKFHSVLITERYLLGYNMETDGKLHQNLHLADMSSAVIDLQMMLMNQIVKRGNHLLLLPVLKKYATSSWSDVSVFEHKLL